jgi:hypothetical protein
MGIMSWFKSKSKKEQEEIEATVDEIVEKVVREATSPGNKIKTGGKEVCATVGKAYRISSRNMARAKSRIKICRKHIPLTEGKYQLEFQHELKRWVDGMKSYKEQNEITENIVDEYV